ncbi:MAG: enoyl-CoA hydratase/isomerase family protein [Alphaproteobacteria bacterium]|nr:enoyl-CoA hydratase/isomerase family protein [Alphaproteobacteria bacterium]
MQITTDAAASWVQSRPEVTKDFQHDAEIHSKHWLKGYALLEALPEKAKRSADQERSAEAILTAGRESREAFMRRHAQAVYAALTRNQTSFVRAEPLVYAAAKLIPGLVPTRAQVDAQSEKMQSRKDGIEVDQGIFFSHILARPDTGTHFCHAMLLPRAEALAALGEFHAKGEVDLGTAAVVRQGKAGIVFMRNPRYLNAEDETTLQKTEIAVDLAILDPATELCVLRGDTVQNPKYAGKRVFSTGINLTHIYNGKISYLWYITREMGFVNKMMRGLARADADPDEIYGGTIEKPWVAGVEHFAIGGGCQYLLTMDYVVAASDAYMTLPARKEGIIPGASNMRMWRFTGDRIARQAIMMGRRLDCDTPEGRTICDEIVAPGEMDAALARVIAGFTDSGVVSAAGNRRAFRVVEEPLDDFRRYMAVYAREQAYCHFAPALIRNLEKHWNAQQRKM